MTGEKDKAKVGEHDCFVYVVSVEGMDMTKIGITKNPNSRLRQLRTGSPFKMRFDLLLRVPDVKTARFLESSFHHVMRDKRMNGEWFSMSSIAASQALVLNLIGIMEHFIAQEDEHLVPRMFELAGVPDWGIELLNQYGFRRSLQ